MEFSESELNQIFNLLEKAGASIMEVYTSGNIDIDIKEDNSPVTRADFQANSIITEGLKALFPQIPIISEEEILPPFEIRKTWEFTWLLDPLDGTKEFIKKTDEFSINLALIQKGEPVLGFIYLPVFKSMYYAVKNKGAFEISSDKKTQMQVSKFRMAQEGIKVVISKSHLDKQTSGYIDTLNNPKTFGLGSALKFISIAKGQSDYYPRMIHIMEWDTAAGQILIEEAGGSLVDSTQRLPLRYNKEYMKNPTFIASGKII